MARGWQLFAVHVSSWSERARWALDHHRLPFDEVPHVPMLGEQRLRRLARRAAPRDPPPARATVPLLVANDDVVMDSWNIARYVDHLGTRSPLIPPDREAEIAAWNAASDEMLRSIRALVLIALLASPAALDASQPGFIPRSLRGVLRPIARRGVRYLGRKHGLTASERADHHVGLVVPHLDRLRAALAARPASAPHLLGDFGYADVVMASSLQGVLPVADHYLALPPPIREVWTRPQLASEYADLLAWRDRIYDQHRRPT